MLHYHCNTILKQLPRTTPLPQTLYFKPTYVHNSIPSHTLHSLLARQPGGCLVIQQSTQLFIILVLSYFKCLNEEVYAQCNVTYNHNSVTVNGIQCEYVCVHAVCMYIHTIHTYETLEALLSLLWPISIQHWMCDTSSVSPVTLLL